MKRYVGVYTHMEKSLL